MVMGVSRFLDGFRMENPVKIRMITRGTPLGGNPNLVGGLDAIFYFSINIGFLIIPIDELHHFSGRGGEKTTNQFLWFQDLASNRYPFFWTMQGPTWSDGPTVACAPI